MYTIQGVLLPADGVTGNVTGNDAEAIVGTVRPNEFPENCANKSIKSAMGIRRTNGTRYFVILFLVLVVNDPLIWHKKITYRFLCIVWIIPCFACTIGCRYTIFRVTMLRYHGTMYSPSLLNTGAHCKMGLA